MKKMKNLIALNTEELISINGGHAPLTKNSSFGEDVGYICGWLVGAFCNAASMIKG
jgi:hypothetical protein